MDAPDAGRPALEKDSPPTGDRAAAALGRGGSNPSRSGASQGRPT
jgi:hypothetical protein